MQGGGTIENQGTIRAYGQFNPATPAAQTPIGVVMTATPDQQGRSATLTNDGLVQGFIGVVATGSLETVTIDNEGAIIGQGVGITGQSTGDLIVNNGEDAQIVASGNAIAANTSTLIVDNAGLIQSQGQVGINIASANAVIVNSGGIVGGTNAITTAALQTAPNVFVNTAVNASVANSGYITAQNGTGVRFQGGGSVANSGSISGTVDGVYIAMLPDQDAEDFSATVANEADGEVSGGRFGVNLMAGGSVENDGSISGGFTGVVVQNALGLADVAGSVTNSGSITGTNAFGVAFDGLASATLTNSGTITGGGNDGVNVSYMAGGHTMIDNQDGATITSAASGIRIDDGTAEIVNAGTIRGNGTSTDLYFYPDAGITVTGGVATITNSGTISGNRLGITTAPYMDPFTGEYSGVAVGATVVNSGTIIAKKTSV